MIKKHNYMVLKNKLNEGIYFIKKKDALQYIKECKSRNLSGNYEIIKMEV